MKKRKLRRKEIKKKNIKIISSILLLIFLLVVGYGAFQTTISIYTTGHIVVDERCIEGNVFNFTQKNETQEFKVPCSGTYKLETWGASGGNALNLEGGYGGYSVGNIVLNIKQNLYIIVGGEGESTLELEAKDSNYYISLNGGYNGGGNATSGQCGSGLSLAHFRYAASGGGATHIAKDSDLLTEFSNKTDNLYIVSGGGGGALTFKSTASGAYGPGGSAGGQIGNTAFFLLGTHTETDYATGGTQIAGGSSGTSYYNENASNRAQSGTFGKGGDFPVKAACTTGSGGGSGLYGGGAAWHAPGAGGSSYIGNTSLTDKAMYCYNCTESLDLTKPEIFTVSTTGNSNYKDTINCPDGYNENPVSKCAKKGDGYARITLISKK